MMPLGKLPLAGLRASEAWLAGAFLVGLGPSGGPLGSQMVDLGCLDTDWVGGNDKDVLDAILLCDGLKL